MWDAGKRIDKVLEDAWFFFFVGYTASAGSPGINGKWSGMAEERFHCGNGGLYHCEPWRQRLKAKPLTRTKRGKATVREVS